VPNYGEVYYTDIYDGIDLRYYTNERGLKYDFIVHPGAEVEQIRMRWEGAEGLEVDENGDLVIKTELYDIKDTQLFIYQNNQENRDRVQGYYILFEDIEFGFGLAEEYNQHEILIIDPFL